MLARRSLVLLFASGLLALPLSAEGRVAEPACGAMAVPPAPGGCGSSQVGGPLGSLPNAPCAPVPLADDRCETWVSTFDHPGGHGTMGIDMPFDAKMSADGATLFVTGQSWQDEKDAYDFATIAYDTATGAQKWLARYDGPGDAHDIPQQVALSPDGSRLYVTGWVHMNPVGEGADYATVAYATATGAQLWDATYEGPDEGDDSSYGVAVSPDGAWVYVVGKSGIGWENMDYATIAYRADTGERAWVARYSSVPGSGEDTAISVVVSPDGRAVFVTGAGGTTLTTIAYRGGETVEGEPAPGTELWRATHSRGYAYWIALSPDGKTVHVTGSKHQNNSGVLVPNWDYVTIAYEASTGVQKWLATWASPNVGLDVPYGHALSPAGDRIFLTGSATGSGPELNSDFVTVALSTADGSFLWESRYETPGSFFEGGATVGVSPDGARVFAAGWSSPGFGGPGLMVTRSYEAATGVQRWQALFSSLRTPQEQDFADALAVAPNGARVFVTGRASYQMDPDDPANQQPGGNSTDYVTIAYEA